MLFLRKVVSVVTVICLAMSSFVSQGFGMVDNNVSKNSTTPITSNSLIPSNIGRITDATYFGSSKIVVNIQDLHCHSEVQRNIAKILGVLDTNYNLKQVYVEGGIGQVDTSWINLFENKNLQNDIAETLVNSGKLSGAEYYSIKEGKYNLLTGLEDKKVYEENLARLKAIIEQKDDINQKLQYAKSDLENLKQNYFSYENKKIENLTANYNNEKLDAARYYAKLLNIAKDKKMSVGDYKTIQQFINVSKLQRRISNKRVSKELNGYLLVLKNQLPYNVYSSLMGKIGKDNDLLNFYTTLAKITKDYKITFINNYPNLNKFFAFLSVNQNINPVELINEERDFLRELKYTVSKCYAEKEVVFLNEFFTYLSDYLNYKISADDYTYFNSNINEFKTLWARYLDKTKIEEIANHFKLCEDFYKANQDRNKIFVKKIFNEIKDVPSPETRLIPDVDHVSMALKSINNVQSSKFNVQSQDEKTIDVTLNIEPSTLNTMISGSPEIIVIVSGGFHTEGLKNLLKDRRITYITITPNVTQDSKSAQNIYETMAREQHLSLKTTTTPENKKLAKLNMPLVGVQFIEPASCNCRFIGGFIDYKTKSNTNGADKSAITNLAETGLINQAHTNSNNTIAMKLYMQAKLGEEMLPEDIKVLGLEEVEKITEEIMKDVVREKLKEAWKNFGDNTDKIVTEMRDVCKNNGGEFKSIGDRKFQYTYTGKSTKVVSTTITLDSNGNVLIDDSENIKTQSEPANIGWSIRKIFLYIYLDTMLEWFVNDKRNENIDITINNLHKFAKGIVPELPVRSLEYGTDEKDLYNELYTKRYNAGKENFRIETYKGEFIWTDENRLGYIKTEMKEGIKVYSVSEGFWKNSNMDKRIKAIRFEDRKYDAINNSESDWYKLFDIYLKHLANDEYLTEYRGQSPKSIRNSKKFDLRDLFDGCLHGIINRDEVRTYIYGESQKLFSIIDWQSDIRKEINDEVNMLDDFETAFKKSSVYFNLLVKMFAFGLYNQTFGGPLPLKEIVKFIKKNMPQFRDAPYKQIAPEISTMVFSTDEYNDGVYNQLKYLAGTGINTSQCLA